MKDTDQKEDSHLELYKKNTMHAYPSCMSYLLAGCGNSAENSDISEKLKEKAETVSGQEASAGSIIP